MTEEGAAEEPCQLFLTVPIENGEQGNDGEKDSQHTNEGVYIPEHLDKEERKLIEKLQDSPNIVPGSADKKNFFRNLFGI